MNVKQKDKFISELKVNSDFSKSTLNKLLISFETCEVISCKKKTISSRRKSSIAREVSNYLSPTKSHLVSARKRSFMLHGKASRTVSNFHIFNNASVSCAPKCITPIHKTISKRIFNTQNSMSNVLKKNNSLGVLRSKITAVSPLTSDTSSSKVNYKIMQDNCRVYWKALKKKVKELIKTNRKKKNVINLKEVMKTAMVKQEEKEITRKLAGNKCFKGLTNNRSSFSKYRLNILKRNINENKEKKDDMKKRKKEKEIMDDILTALYRKNKIKTFQPYVPTKNKVLKKLLRRKSKRKIFDEGHLDSDNRNVYIKNLEGKERFMLEFQQLIMNSNFVKYPTQKKAKPKLPKFKSVKKKYNLNSINDCY